MHLEALGKEGATGGVGWHLKWYVTLIFAYFLSFFAILGVFHAFGCVWEL